MNILFFLIYPLKILRRIFIQVIKRILRLIILAIILINNFFDFYKRKKYIQKKIKKKVFSKHRGAKPLRPLLPKKPSFKLSICIPALVNSQLRFDLFKSTLNSVYKSVKNLSSEDKKLIEICLFDNASNFDLKKHLEIFSQEIHTIYTRSEKVLTIDKSFHNNFDLSTGEFIWNLMADDACNENFLKNILNAIDDCKYNQLILARGKSYKLDGSIIYDYQSLYKNHYKNFLPISRILKHPIPSSTWICHRLFYEKFGIIGSLSTGADLRLLFAKYKYYKIIRLCNEAEIKYIDHADSGNAKYNPKNFRKILWFINTLKYMKLYKFKNENKAFNLYFSYYLDDHISTMNENNKKKFLKFLKLNKFEIFTIKSKLYFDKLFKLISRNQLLKIQPWKLLFK